jgi:DNA-binding response OmpR family regulator
MAPARILICDDEEGVRESLKLILEDTYQLEVAMDGAEAVRRVAEAPFALMILDLKMPQMDGIETLRRVRKISATMPVLILTAYQSVDIAKESVRLGANDYLSKPFDSTQVLEVVSRLLSRQQHVA